MDKLIKFLKSFGLKDGEEDIAYCEQLKEHVAIIKVFRVGALVPNMEGFDKVADYFLFDTDSALYGGTGQHFNWEIIKNQTIAKPYFLRGGIGPNDLKGLEVMQATKAGKQLRAVDINSQFESSPGIKDIEKIKTFTPPLI